MPRISAIEPSTATGVARATLDAVGTKLGMVPNIFRTMAHSASVLTGYLSFGEALAGGRFDAKSREAIALAVAGASGCDYCASAHTAVSKSLKVDGAEIELRLEARSSDPKLNAALVFARRIVEKRGLVNDDDIATVRAAGHDDEAIVEIIANVAANIFTNYFNHVSETEVDFPLVRVGREEAA
jgi:uncharacterized peroxidase-related enzyme